MKITSGGFVANSGEGDKKIINSELWHACAGPVVALPPVGSHVVYFPQGHSEQVAASMQKETDGVPSYPNLPSKLICMLHNVTLHADAETDEVYAQMTLQPVNKEALLVSDIGLKHNRQPAEFFCKNLTASDTSTHGGFSVPRRAAEKIFPPLDFSMQPPAEELSARDLHDQTWTFRHIYRGQPKRHLLTTGWSMFVSSKRLVAGDAVLFIRDEKSQLLLGIRRANRQQQALSSSVISSDSMHIGILAAASHATANNSPFTIFYNPRASPSEFVIPLAKYNKATYTQVSPGMRFRMMFETEESGVRRYMGTVTGISDLDSVRWKNSQWRNLQVGWDESTTGERPGRVSIWEVEPVVTPFYICPPPFFRPKFPRHPSFPDDELDMENIFKRGMPWIADDFGIKDASSSIFPGLSLVQWMSMQQNNQLSSNQSGLFPDSSVSTNDHTKLLNFQNPSLASHYLPPGKGNLPNLQVGQQQQVQLMSQSPTKTQQLPLQQPQPQLVQHTLQQLPLQQPQPQLVQHTLQQQRLPQPPVLLPPVTNGFTLDQAANQNSHQMGVYPQLQQQQILTGNAHLQQNDSLVHRTTFPVMSMTQDFVFPQPVEQQSSLLQRPQQQQLQLQQALLPVLQRQKPQMQQFSQQNLADQQMQLQLLQKLQQQQQLSSPLNPSLEAQCPPKQQLQQNQHGQNLCLPPGSSLVQSPQFPINQFQHKSPLENIRGRVEEDAPSCSTSPSKYNFQASLSNFFNRYQTGPTTLLDNATVHHTTNLAQETHTKIDIRMKHEFPNSKPTEQPKYKGTATYHLDAASTGISYCQDTGSLQQNFQLNGLETDVQSHTRNSLPFTGNIDGLAPDALLSRGYDSGKDIQNLLSNYSGTPKDIDTDLSSGINSQSFGLPETSFKPGCSNEVAINESAVLSGGLWSNQAPRMRTYAKVQKRGSVGRTVDVTRYKGYDELKHDLALMFGIEGLLEDPQRTEWKLVYVDHENDILLVGDDPWEEFVSCVQSIKILSSAEVQQMSLDVDLGQMPIPNQACSQTDSGNAWRGQYDNNSATSFNG